MTYYATIKEIIDKGLNLSVYKQAGFEAGEVILIANEENLYVAENVYNTLQTDYLNAIDNIFITQIL